MAIDIMEVCYAMRHQKNIPDDIMGSVISFRSFWIKHKISVCKLWLLLEYKLTSNKYVMSLIVLSYPFLIRYIHFQNPRWWWKSSAQVFITYCFTNQWVTCMPKSFVNNLWLFSKVKVKMYEKTYKNIKEEVADTLWSFHLKTAYF